MGCDKLSPSGKFRTRKAILRIAGVMAEDLKSAGLRDFD
jgi:hypothetical protein